MRANIIAAIGVGIPNLSNSGNICPGDMPFSSENLWVPDQERADRSRSQRSQILISPTAQIFSQFWPPHKLYTPPIEDLSLIGEILQSPRIRSEFSLPAETERGRRRSTVRRRVTVGRRRRSTVRRRVMVGREKDENAGEVQNLRKFAGRGKALLILVFVYSFLFVSRHMGSIIPSSQALHSQALHSQALLSQSLLFLLLQTG
ncbi:hypothetical protein EV426DRAFT_719026 [Tirmania nivea]|nr:hypothetical protein EV426DRAFT_719026 [Tirmania nivea]